MQAWASSRGMWPDGPGALPAGAGLDSGWGRGEMKAGHCEPTGHCGAGGLGCPGSQELAVVISASAVEGLCRG